eukprot:TRINITY_DN3198_c0_g1_i4.p1 TRINITY_DN3198_c0_g1~~TRINITY_DN3198_c0_g1_i4.p1  ORF type:complete len:443 (+),score=79.85 TRINITY_DN3198_c0_g1_i4:201-1331(+)
MTVHWPLPLLRFFQLPAFLSAVAITPQLGYVDCLVQGPTSLATFASIVVVTPLILCLVCVAAVYGAEAAARLLLNQYHSLPILKLYALRSMLFVLFYAHPALFLFTLRFFHCTDEPNSVLVFAPHISCSGPDYAAWHGGLSAFLALYCVGLPVWVGVLFFDRRRRYRAAALPRQASSGLAAQHGTVQAQSSHSLIEDTGVAYVLTIAFRGAAYYWELYLLVRKMFFAAFVVFFAGPLQIVAGGYLLLCSLLHHSLARPHVSLMLYQTEALSLSILLFSLVLGVVADSADGSNTDGVYAATALIVAANGLFFFFGIIHNLLADDEGVLPPQVVKALSFFNRKSSLLGGESFIALQPIATRSPAPLASAGSEIRFTLS